MENYKEEVETKFLKILKKSGMCLLVMTIILYFVLAIKFMLS